MKLSPLSLAVLTAAGTLGIESAHAQTCSCAAVPLLGSMQSSPTNEGEWYIGTTYEFHDVSDLVAGSTTIPDATGRERRSTALVVEASRGLTDKWSISMLVSAIEHERAVGGEFVTGSGLGDGMLIAKYAFRNISLYSDSALAVGFGARLAIGADDLTRDGVFLAEDMHPSTGANGGIAWVYWARAMNDSAGTQIYASASYASNGKNFRNYRFGDESIVTFGSTIQTRGRWGFNVELSFRDAERDRRLAGEITNTGGQWLDLNAAVQFRVNEALAVSVGGSVPVARDLHDQLQFTTNYATRASLSYVFGDRR